MSRKYFGTDGVRGKVGGDNSVLTPEFAMRLGYAAGNVLVKHAKENVQSGATVHPAVLIGKDTRISGYMLESAMEAGFSAAGVDVLLCGPIPTPAVAYLTRAFRVSAGVVISASHNPYDDNGIKFFSHLGDKLSDEIEHEIEAELDAIATQGMRCVESKQLGKAKRVEDAAGRYIEFCKSTFPSGLDLHGLRLVVDCAHGAAYQVAPNVFKELGAQVITMGNTPDGVNINDGFGATHPQRLIEAVQQQQVDLGLALDGDADRLLVVDKTGRLYSGDELIYVLAKDRLAQGTTAQELGGVVGTLMTNIAVEHAIRDLHLKFIRANVGDRYVLEKLRENDWLIGGEGSGHILCLDKHSTGDGIIAALQVLAAMKRQNKTLAQLLDGVVLFPQLLHNIRLQPGENWEANQPLQTMIKKLQEKVAGNGRILVRKSGTEPVVRVMVEAPNLEQIKPLLTVM